MASITVPTERSAHYGLRPPPAGSPTTMAGAAAAAAAVRPPDSVFVHARQAQLAQQAAIAQQQQQVLTLTFVVSLLEVLRWSRIWHTWDYRSSSKNIYDVVSELTLLCHSTAQARLLL